jgi:hypothetical protein
VDASRERTAVLVIRAWLEANGEPRLRARITQTVDVARREETSTLAASRAEIAAAVEKWLDAVLGDGALTEP